MWQVQVGGRYTRYFDLEDLYGPTVAENSRAIRRAKAAIRRIARAKGLSYQEVLAKVRAAVEPEHGRLEDLSLKAKVELAQKLEALAEKVERTQGKR